MIDIRTIRDTEGGRIVTFRYRLFPEIAGGLEVVTYISVQPAAFPPSDNPTAPVPTFGVAVISGYDVDVPVLVDDTMQGIRYLVKCTVLTDKLHPLTCEGYLRVEDVQA